MFVHSVTARFYEIDRAGIVFFGRFFEYCHSAFEEMMLAAFDDWDDLLTSGPWLLPLVHVESDFRRPVRLGERLKIELTWDRLGRTSVTFGYRVRGSDGSERASLRFVHAFVERNGLRPCSVSSDFVTALDRIGVCPIDRSED